MPRYNKLKGYKRNSKIMFQWPLNWFHLSERDKKKIYSIVMEAERRSIRAVEQRHRLRTPKELKLKPGWENQAIKL